MRVKREGVRERLAAGAVVTGVIVFTGSPVIVELSAAAGLDFVILDMEHSALDLGAAVHLIRAADAAGIAAYVRVPDVDHGLVVKLLDLGAAGIVLPHATPARSRELLAAMRYAPEGSRGACQITRSAGYRRGDWARYAARANREVMAIALVEDAEVLRDFDAFAQMPGIDAFFVGPTDLSVALGVPGATFDEPVLGAALDSVASAAKMHGKHAMTLIGNNLDSDYAKRIAARGVRMIVLGTDADLFVNSITSFAGLKQHGAS